MLQTEHSGSVSNEELEWNKPGGWEAIVLIWLKMPTGSESLLISAPGSTAPN